MNRREFLGQSVALGVGLPMLGQTKQSKAIAEGGPLTLPKDGPIMVAIAVSKGTTWIDFDGPMAAFETYRFDPIEKKHKPLFKTFFVSEKTDPVNGLIPDYTFDTAPHAHIVLVPAQSGSDSLLEYLKKTVETSDITMSVCIGARHLAKAGLLDGLKATSHHESLEGFKKAFPLVNWQSGLRFVEGKKISTGGGLTAGIDLGLRVCERYFGRDWATQVAAHLEYQGVGWMV